MSGISPGLAQQIRTTLLSCGPFSGDRELYAVFVDARISPWRNTIPQAHSPGTRVNAIISHLIDRHNTSQQNALVLFLRVLGERMDPGDVCHRDLGQAADMLEQELGQKPRNDETETVGATIQSPDNILIVTVTKVEARAVLDVFSQLAGVRWRRQVIGNKTYYNLGFHGGASVFMVQSEMGIATPGGALLTVRQAIQDLQPQAVIMCGIAFGLHPDKQQLGDILVAKQIQYYEPQKLDVRLGKIPRGDRVTSSMRLLDRFRSGDIDWKGAPTHFGLVLSGEKLVNNLFFRDSLLISELEAIGGEMEGAGLYAAARDAKVDWILVKAICDWADGEKHDAAQLLAANNAAQFVLHVLRLGGWGEVARDLLNGVDARSTEATQTAPHIDRTRLRQTLIDRFDLEELRTLCADLDVDYNSLPAQGKAGKARELVAFMRRQERLPELVTMIKQARPIIP